METILLLRDCQKTTTEIREHLKERFGITEPRGIRLHLEQLCQKDILEKDIKNGIGTSYFWKNSPESFGKITNMISENSETVREILRGRKLSLKTRGDTELKKRLEDTSIAFDATAFWYNTEYTKSFLTKSTLKHFIDTAYQKCRHERLFLDYCRQAGSSPTMKLFRLVLLENNDNETLLLLMRYSPSLVRYIVNLGENCMERLGSLDQRKDVIFQMMVKDMMMTHYAPHGGGFFSSGRH